MSTGGADGAVPEPRPLPTSRSAAAGLFAASAVPWIVAVFVAIVLMRSNMAIPAVAWGLWLVGHGLWRRREPGGFGGRFTPPGIAVAVVALVIVLVTPTGGSNARRVALVLLSTVALDCVISVWVVRRVGLQCDMPRDGQVGESRTAGVTISRLRQPIWIRMSSLARTPWLSADRVAVGEYPFVPEARGVFPEVEFVAMSLAPLGLVRVSRSRVLRLAQSIEVAPKRLPLEGFDQRLLPLVHEQDLAESDVHGLRPYIPGDPPRAVHWSATARTGSLHVRIYEPPRAKRITILVDLGREPGECAERAASRGAWAADELLRQSWQVTLVTREAIGIVDAQVWSPLEAGRRLARAVNGPPINDVVTAALVVDPDGWSCRGPGE